MCHFSALSVRTQGARPVAKRPQENMLDVESWVETKFKVGIMLCKAEALVQLERPVEADELYRRFVITFIFYDVTTNKVFTYWSLLVKGL